MSVKNEIDNPLAEVLIQEGESGTLETNPATGQTRFVPTPAVLSSLKTYLATLLDDTKKSYEERHDRWRRYALAYKGKNDKANDVTITIPICKRDTNQQSAWLSNQILGKDPVVSVKPRTDKKFSVPKYDENGQVAMEQPPAPPQDPMAAMMGMPPQEPPPPQPIIEQMTSEEAAQDIEDRIAYESQHVTHWDDILDDQVIPDVLKYGLAWIKQCYETPEQKLIERTLSYDTKQEKFVWGAQPKSVENGAVIIPRVPSPFNVMLPPGETDPQDSSALWEKQLMSNQDILVKITNGQFDFCLPKKQKPEESVLDAVYGTDSANAPEMMDAERNSASRKQEVYEVYFKYPVSINGQTQIMEFCAYYHEKAKELLNCYVNDLPQKMRPYDVAFMRPDSHEFDGDSTVGDVLPFQNLESQLFHLQIQNMVMSNVKVFLYRKGGSTEKWFNEHPTIKPGDRIPFDEKDDISPQPLGSPIAGVSAEIGFLNAEAEKMSVVNEYDRGSVPNRTAGSTVEQVQQLAKMQPSQILRRIRRPINRALTRHVQMLAHYAPEAKQIATTDERGAVSTRFARFPLEQITEADFDIHLTATAEDESNQAELERDVMLGKDIQAENQQALQFLGMMMQPNVPPPFQNFLRVMLQRSEENLGAKFAKFRKDWRDLVIKPEDLAAAMNWLAQAAAQAPPQPEQQPQGAPPQGPPQGMPMQGGMPQ